MRLPADAYCDVFVARTDAHRDKRMHAFVYGRVGVDGDDDEEWNDNRGRMELMLNVEYLVRTAWLNSRVEMLRRGEGV
jgi:hypothetical protein